MTMNFRTTKQIREAFNTCRKEGGKMPAFPIALKVAAVKHGRTKWLGTSKAYAKSIGVAYNNLYLWGKHLDEGMYVEGATFSVSRSALASTTQIVKDLTAKVVMAQKQLDLAMECEKNGLTVSIAA